MKSDMIASSINDNHLDKKVCIANNKSYTHFSANYKKNNEIFFMKSFL
jgi:hypothetical protein